MEVVYFALGMALIIQILAIITVYTLKTKLGQLEIELQYLERSSHDVVRDIHLRIENEVRELQFHNNETLLRIEKELSELHRQISKTKKVV